MSGRKTGIFPRIASWFLLVIFSFIFFMSVAGVSVLMKTGAYWDGGRILRESIADEVFTFDKVRIRYVLNEYKRYSVPNDAQYREMYDPERSNVFFVIKDSKGAILADYGSDAQYQMRYEYEELYIDSGKPITEKKYFATREEAAEYIEELEEDYVISGWSYNHEEGELEVIFYEYQVYTVEAFIRRDLLAKDRYYYSLKAVDVIVALRYWVILIGVISAVMCVLLVIYLCSAEARLGVASGERSFNFIHRIPLDVYFTFCALCCVCMVAVFSELTLGDEYEALSIFMFVCIFTVCLLLAASAIITFAARLKDGYWWKNTFIFFIVKGIAKLLGWFWSGSVYIVKQIPLFWKAILALIAVKAVEFIFLLLGFEIYAAFWILESAAVVFAVVYIVIALRKLQKAAAEMSNGDLDYRADLTYMPGVLREHGYNLNHIGAGLKTALDEQVKSEHMKAELITNVSHDIKTPLTSIVNYVGLLKKEGLGSDSAEEYLGVLERQAIKLKKLTEDLIDASKATAGCVKVNAERTDVNVLLSQACGEYEGKFMEKELIPILSLADENPSIYADGGLVWRVFDNLLNNICKYSQRGTRVYLRSSLSGGKVTVSFSNISEAQLNISSDELMERFVRGDVSRNTEGSGLGLSIARSLVELQKGSFDIKIDGDLFKAELIFDVME